jgi:hypothetical protein
MTDEAQRDIVIGAICSDKHFRRDLFTCESEQEIADTLATYAARKQIQAPLNAAVAPAWALRNHPDRDRYFGDCVGTDALVDTVLRFCRVWPCR